MSHEIALSLELLDESAEKLRLRLAVRNASSAKMLFPYPEIHGLRFGNSTTMEESEWYTGLFVSSRWAGFTLEPGEVKEIDFCVRPCSVENPREGDCADYCRWCVDLPAGEYLVWYRFRVGEDYFCGDSHCRFSDLLRKAEFEGAVVWTGETMTNRLRITRRLIVASTDEHNRARIGLYVHVPFCASSCEYRDFASFAGRQADIPRYVPLPQDDDHPAAVV